MAQYWCINCKKEVEHRAYYCHSKCENECEEVCSVCNRRTLTTVSDELDKVDISENNAVKWATGKAQRQSRDTGTKVAEVPIPRPGTNGVYRFEHLTYYALTEVIEIQK